MLGEPRLVARGAAPPTAAGRRAQIVHDRNCSRSERNDRVAGHDRGHRRADASPPHRTRCGRWSATRRELPELVRLRGPRRGARGRRRRAAAPPARALGQEALGGRPGAHAWEPERTLAWRHQAERLDGKPAPRFAASTDFTIELDAGRRAAHACALHSAQEPAGPVARARDPRRSGAASWRQTLARLARRGSNSAYALSAGCGAVERTAGRRCSPTVSISVRMFGCATVSQSVTPLRAQALREAREVDHQRRVGERAAPRGRRSRRAWPSAPRRTVDGGGRWWSDPRPPRSSGSPAARRSETIPATYNIPPGSYRAQT